MINTTKPMINESLLDVITANLQSVNAGRSSSKSAGRWTKEEHQRFVEAIQKYGKNWKLVEDHVATRSGAQIRSHAQKFFNRLEREYNTKLDTSNLQGSQQIKESLRKISESSTSPSISLINEGIEEMKIEAKLAFAKNPTEKTPSKSQMVDFGSPVSRSTFVQETQSVPTDSPKHNSLAGLSGFKKNPRKMSEDIIGKQSMSIFDVVMSKIRTSNHGIDFPKLSDLVDLSFRANNTNIGFRSFGDKAKEVQNSTSSFKVHPRKISEDNILITNTLQKLRRPSMDDLSEFEVLTKQVKRV